MTSSPSVSIKNGQLEARIALRGAELRSLRWHDREFIWNGNPAWWSYSAPILFPIIGKTTGQRITHQGKPLHLPTHGFARDMVFEVQHIGSDHVEFVLGASEETLAMYPFEFELAVRFEARPQGLHQVVQVTNLGDVSMPASFGFHPAFCWENDVGPTESYHLSFSDVEINNTYRVDENRQLLPLRIEELEEGISLKLDRTLLGQGTVVIDPVASSSLVLTRHNEALLKMGWTGCHQLALWTLPGAPFICLEPWCGLPGPAGFDGDLTDQPGSFLLQPHQTKQFQLDIDF